MKIIEQENKIRCDVAGCKNLASFSLVGDGGNKSQYINVCKDCLQEIYKQSAKLLVPKSPTNMFNKPIYKGGYR